MNKIRQDAEQRMKKSLETLKHDLTKVRTGRANPGLLENLTVSCYGNDMPLNQLASVSASDSRILLITPWDKNNVSAIEKAIQNSDLGLNPATAGTAIRVPMPPLNEERRKELIKVVRQEGESARVAIRNIRRDANNAIKELLKKKEITEDDERRAQDSIQKLTDSHIQEVDKLVSSKETDLLEV